MRTHFGCLPCIVAVCRAPALELLATTRNSECIHFATEALFLKLCAHTLQDSAHLEACGARGAQAAVTPQDQNRPLPVQEASCTQAACVKNRPVLIHVSAEPLALKLLACPSAEELAGILTTQISSLAVQWSMTSLPRGEPPLLLAHAMQTFSWHTSPEHTVRTWQLHGSAAGHAVEHDLPAQGDPPVLLAQETPNPPPPGRLAQTAQQHARRETDGSCARGHRSPAAGCGAVLGICTGLLAISPTLDISSVKRKGVGSGGRNSGSSSNSNAAVSAYSGSTTASNISPAVFWGRAVHACAWAAHVLLARSLTVSMYCPYGVPTMVAKHCTGVSMLRVVSKKQEHASDAALCVTRTCIKKCASCIRVSGKAPRSCCSPWDQPWCTVASLSNVDCCLHCLHALNYRQTASMVVGVPWPIAGALLLDCCLHCLHAHAPTDEALSEHMSLTHQKMAAILARALEKRHFDCNDGDVLLPIKPSRAFHTMVLWFQVRLIVAGGLKDRNVAT
eukprot:scaffold45728_cov22-Tisochrysis_lutea.AAC.1